MVNSRIPMFYLIWPKSKYKKVGVISMWKAKFNVSSVGSTLDFVFPALLCCEDTFFHKG